VIAHQAALRVLYAYYQGIAPEACTRLAIPLHTLIQLRPHAYGCDETRIALEPRA
jgi:6-phosphofructo-2-kinase/fructose-2,6-biphosphatase 2